MSILDTVLATLRERILSTGSWTLTRDELEALMDPVTLYRAVYALKLIGRDAYTPSSAGELVGLLERAVASDAELRMRDAGLFLGHEDRVGLTERFVRHVHRAIVLHVPDPEMFRGMIEQFKRYDIAEQTYCDTYLSMAPIIEACAAEHAKGREGSAVHQLTARWYLRTLVERRIIVPADLGPALFDLLRSIGRQEGALPGIAADAHGPGPWAAAGEQAERESVEDDRAGAIVLLELRSSHPSRAEVRSQYRRLMRQYHPDLNPDGLEMAKRINTAYAVLLTSAGRR